MFLLKGIRGAITIERDQPEEVAKATRELLETIFKENNLTVNNVVAVLFTQTKDIVSAYPAKTARELGLKGIPLMSAQEPDVIGGMPRVIRVLLFVDLGADENVKHVYLKGAAKLREDLA
nr:chorismate mutase [Carboxydothermus hydrogenoformans]